MQLQQQQLRQLQHQIQHDGYCIVRNALSPGCVDNALIDLQQALSAYETARESGKDPARQAAGSIRSRNGKIYAARNILDLLPQAGQLWRTAELCAVLQQTLGGSFGLVRGLYFDKHPESPWSLPWHQDLTIAVERNDLPSERFANPTTKAGVKHVEAPCDVLENMLSLRIHLDDVTTANGPLKVIAGSHRHGKSTQPGSTRNSSHAEDAADSPPGDSAIHTIVCSRGDVLAMRPLLAHSSGNPTPGAAAHRRVVHLEFAAHETLADGYRWQSFRKFSPDHRPV